VRRRAREGEGKRERSGEGKGGKERGRDLPDQCQTASYAPVSNDFWTASSAHAENRCGLSKFPFIAVCV